MDWNWPYPPGDKTEMWFNEDVVIHHANPDEWTEVKWRRKWFKPHYRPILKWRWDRIAIVLGTLLWIIDGIGILLWTIVWR